MSNRWERWPRTEDAVELECACACGQAAECKGTAGATLEPNKYFGFDEAWIKRMLAETDGCDAFVGPALSLEEAARIILDLEASKGSVATTIAAPEQPTNPHIPETRMDYSEREPERNEPEEDERRQQDADVLAAHDSISGYLRRAAKVCPPTILEAASIAWLHGVEVRT